MSDTRLRELERIYHGGDLSALPALNIVRRRMGLPQIRDRIIHYLPAEYSHAVGNDGWIDARAMQYGARPPCSALTLNPRGPHDKNKPCPYTPDKTLVTCKTCLRCMRSPKFSEGKPGFHLLLTLPSGRERTRCGGQFGRSTEVMDEVGCHGCLLVLSGEPRARGHEQNARGRRRLRRQRMFAASR